MTPQQRYVLKHPDRVKASKKKWVEENSEQMQGCRDNYKANNPDDYKASQDKYARENKDVARAGHLRRTYSLTTAEYDAMLEQQGGVCATCKKPETRMHQNGKVTRLCVDHDHNTGEVRGLLCAGCNRMIGYAKDNPDTLREAAAYLEVHNS